MEQKPSYILRQELAELQVAINRKRSEVSNLTVGYSRAEEGIGAIPPEPLKRNLIAARAQLTDLEEQLADLERRLQAAEAAEAASSDATPNPSSGSSAG